MSRKPKDDHTDDVVATGFGRGGTCSTEDQKKHETDAGRKPPKPEPEDNS